MRRRLVLGAVLAAVALLSPPVASACHPAGIFSRSDERVRMDDGVELAVTVYTDQPAGCPHRTTARPAVMLFHGLGGTRQDMNAIAEAVFARHGYVVLTFDARAHGESGGLFDLDGPREIADVRALFQWLGARADVDETRIGALGFSYGGGAIWRAAIEGIPFAAIEPAMTWSNLYEALAPGNLPKSGVIFQLSRLVPAERYAPEPRTLLADALAVRNLAAIRSYLTARSSMHALHLVRTPTFILHGRRDFLFDVDQALAAYGRLPGPKHLYLGNLGHTPATNPPAEREYYLTQARRWFDRFLHGLPNGIDLEPRVEIARDPWDGRVRQVNGVPPHRWLTFRWRAKATIGASGKVVRTARVRAAQETFGSPVVRVSLTPRNRWTHVVAVLSAVTPRGEIVVSEGGTTLAGTSRRNVLIRLLNEVTPIPAGARLRLTLAATSTAQNPGNLLYLVGVPQGARLTVGDATLSLPVLRTRVSTP